MMNVAFTFDDATKDHILFAAPILEKYGYRGIFNIVTDVVGCGDVFLNWEDVRELIHRGHEIAAHGKEYHSGENPDNLLKKWKRGEKDEVWRQVVGSKDAIKQKVGYDVKYFCFPHNATNRSIIKMVRNAGMIPLRCSRPNFGGEGSQWTRTSVGEWIDDQIDQGKKYGALMFHGIVEGWGGFAAFHDKDGTGFEACVREVKERDGHTVRVIKYSDINWPVYERRPLFQRILGRFMRIVQ